MNYFLFIVMGLFWSASFITIKISIAHVDPAMSAWVRVLIAQAVFSITFILTRQKFRIPFSDLWRLWLTGIFTQGLPFLLLFVGESMIEPALASIINSTTAAWALLLNIMIFRDTSQATFCKILGIALGILGVGFIFFPALHHPQAHTEILGIISILGMAISYAIGALFNQHLIHGKLKIALQTNLWHQTCGSLLFLSIAVLFIHPHVSLEQFANMPTILSLLYLGICSTAIAWFIYIHLIGAWGAVRSSSVMYTVPVLAILWDYLFTHISPTFNELCGVVVILVGLTLIQFTPKRRIA